MQYSRAFIFTKRTNMLPYFHGRYDDADLTTIQYERLKANYAAERDVQLILLVRYEFGKTICRIKCPISPMPVKGEFDAIGLSHVISFLRQQGWTYKDKWDLSIFQ